MLSCAKALSAAFQPVSALLVNEKIYQAMLVASDTLGNFAHGYTYSGHPVATAVALEALKIYEETDIVGHVRDVSPDLLAGIRKLADHPLVGHVNGVGLIAGLELVADKAARPPLIITRAEVGELLQRLGRTLDDTAAEVHRLAA